MLGRGARPRGDEVGEGLMCVWVASWDFGGRGGGGEEPTASGCVSGVGLARVSAGGSGCGC